MKNYMLIILAHSLKIHVNSLVNCQFPPANPKLFPLNCGLRLVFSMAYGCLIFLGNLLLLSVVKSVSNGAKLMPLSRSMLLECREDENRPIEAFLSSN